MRAFGDIPIQEKLMAIIMVTTLSALTLTGAGIVFSDALLFRNQLERDLAGLARIVADNSTAALSFEDPAAAADTLASLRARPHIVSACTYRADGSVLATYARPGATARCPSPLLSDQIQFGSADISVWHEVLLDNHRIGALLLLYDLREFPERRRRYGITVFLVLLLSSLIALLLSAKLRAVITRPIAQLVAATKAVAATEDYSIRARKLSGDEMGVLVDGFNDMLARIQSRDVELRKAHDELEERVRERTERLSQQAEELARSNADLQQFAYVASHDLQEPLRMVTSYMQIIADQYRGKLDADADEFIGYAVDGALRMRQLINDLLEYSRVGSRFQQAMPVDCTAILERVRSNLDVALAESLASLTNDPLPEVLADPSQIVQLFQNLIANAVKFRGPSPPQIHISARREGAHWLFSVADNGIGIEEEHYQSIFVIFQRLHDRSEYSGTGIGLAVCKKIVERLGGRIWVDSEPGKGSTFYFILPAVP